MNVDFRPRVGMGWFDSIRYITSNANNVFVPAWGWVGSGNIWKHIQGIKFSSPSGDGLVRKVRHDGVLPARIFVPAWGWVGSADFNRNFKKSSNTI